MNTLAAHVSHEHVDVNNHESSKFVIKVSSKKV